MKLGNQTVSLEGVTQKMLQARVAVAKHELNPIAVAPDSVIPFTDHLQEGIDFYGPKFQWTPQTQVGDAAADLEVSRRAHLKEGALRVLAAVPAIFALSEGSRVASGAGFLTNVPLSNMSPTVGLAMLGGTAAIAYFCLYKGREAFLEARSDRMMGDSLQLVASDRR